MSIAKAIIIGLIRFYRYLISPAKACLFGPSAKCRFTPSCSEYALQAVQQEGVVHGCWLSICRLCRCHPLGGCGHDPVPNSSRPSMTPKTLNRCSKLPVP